MTASEDSDQGMRRRMDGDYEPPILTEPDGGPVPGWDGDDMEGGRR